MVKHNNVIPNAHFHKVCWQNHVKTWFDQAAGKVRRRQKRQLKAARMAPRPTSLLRPAVHPPTIKYNYKIREGRGFTFAELKEAGINRKEALTLGIAVDHRRRNRTTETLQFNVQRLKEYKAKLIVFPRKSGKKKAGDSEASELANATQVDLEKSLPIKAATFKQKPMEITEEMTEESVFHKMRVARADYRLYGTRQKNRLAKASKE